jgi:hypothetical protein
MVAKTDMINGHSQSTKRMGHGIVFDVIGQGIYTRYQTIRLLITNNQNGE